MLPNLSEIFANVAHAHVGCRLRLTIIGGGSARRTALAVQAPRSLREGASALFGSVSAKSFESVDVDLSSIYPRVTGRSAIVGLVSRAGAGSGKGSGTDRQFVFVNGRPVDAPKVARCVGDAWRSIEGDRRSRPAFVLNIQLPTSAAVSALILKRVWVGNFELRDFIRIAYGHRSVVDVNIIPNKRDVIIEHEPA